MKCNKTKSSCKDLKKLYYVNHQIIIPFGVYYKFQKGEGKSEKNNIIQISFRSTGRPDNGIHSFSVRRGYEQGTYGI